MSNFVKQSDGSYADTDLIAVGDIAGRVVDDTQSITIPASGEEITCEEYRNESDCIGAGCYWYDGACHGSPKSEFPWIMIALGGAAVVAVVVAIFLIRR